MVLYLFFRLNLIQVLRKWGNSVGVNRVVHEKKEIKNDYGDEIQLMHRVEERGSWLVANRFDR